MATNFEFYKDEILKWSSTTEGCVGNLFSVCKGVSAKEACDGVGGSCYKCARKVIAFLTEEHIEQPKLTKRERAFCEVVVKGAIARDKNGNLFCYGSKNSITKNVRLEQWMKEDPHIQHIALDNDEFHFIKWEDEKPWSIEDLLKLDVIDEVQEDA